MNEINNQHNKLLIKRLLSVLFLILLALIIYHLLSNIMYPSSAKKKILYCSANEKIESIINIVNGDGSNPYGLVGILGNTTYCYLSWSPNGKQFVFTAKGNDDILRIYKVNIDGSGLILLGNGGVPKWSPDGRLIAFGDDDGLYTMEANGSERKKVSDYFATTPYWSPDGTQIAFVSIVDRNTVLVIVNKDGSKLRELTRTNRNSGRLAWSPDGTKIAFDAVFEDTNYDIGVVNIDQSEIVRLTNDLAEDGHASWSPDGKQIAFESYRDGNPQIYKMNSDGTNQTRLTYNQFWNAEPEWSSADGKIAFVSGSIGIWYIYLINADGSMQIPLTSAATGVCCIYWQP